MTTEQLSNIKQTTNGSLVKNLRWLPTDNIIVGLVRDAILGNPSINEGYVSGQWRSSGVPTNRIKGRIELSLEMSK